MSAQEPIEYTFSFQKQILNLFKYRGEHLGYDVGNIFKNKT